MILGGSIFTLLPGSTLRPCVAAGGECIIDSAGVGFGDSVPGFGLAGFGDPVSGFGEAGFGDPVLGFGEAGFGDPGAGFGDPG